MDIPASYEMNMPPTNSTNSSEPLLVTFHLDINRWPRLTSIPSFENMVMADMELRVMMRINLEWKDSRLQFNNLRADQFQVPPARSLTRPE